MRLIRLRIGAFREDRELKLEFRRGDDSDLSLSFLVGPNGTGKSRVLEAVGRIFSHLSAGISPGMDFDIEYELVERRVLITTEASDPWSQGTEAMERIGAWLLVSEGRFDGWRPEHVQEEWPSDLDRLLPFRVLGLSTGPASRLDWALRRSLLDTLAQRLDPISAHPPPAGMALDEWEEYVAREREMLSAERTIAGDEPRCVALAGNELLLAVLAVLSHPAATAGGNRAGLEIFSRIGISPAESLRAFTFNIGDWTTKLPRQQHRTFESLLDLAVRRIALDTDASPEDPSSAEREQRVIFEMTPALGEWIAQSASTPFVWFNHLLGWLQAGALESVRLVVTKEGGEGLLLAEDFSDGEFLLAGRYGLLSLLQEHRDCLVLFDEPETHFNDRWKVELIYDLVRVLEGASAHVLIATHSDLTLSDADRSDVYMLDLDPDPGADEVPRQPPVSPFAADRGEITTRIFGADSGSGRRALTVIDQALESNDPATLQETLERVGPGFHRFRLQYAALEQEEDAP